MAKPDTILGLRELVEALETAVLPKGLCHRLDAGCHVGRLMSVRGGLTGRLRRFVIPRGSSPLNAGFGSLTKSTDWLGASSNSATVGRSVAHLLLLANEDGRPAYAAMVCKPAIVAFLMFTTEPPLTPCLRPVALTPRPRIRSAMILWRTRPGTAGLPVRRPNTLARS